MKLAIDWDGTVVDVATQEWLPGAVDALRALTSAGHTILIHTCRANWPEGLAAVRAKLERDHVAADVWCELGKPNCDLFIDNQAVHFDGDWDTILAHLRGAPVPASKPTLKLAGSRNSTSTMRGSGRTWR